MPTNAQLTDEYLALVAERGGDAQGRLAAREHMNNSTAIYHHVVVDSSYVPRLYNRETHERFTYIAETTYLILSKVMREYLENPSYRHVYDIDPRLVELILLPRGYDALLPFARVDLFLNREHREFRALQGVRRSPPGSYVQRRAVRRMGRRVPQNLRHLRFEGRQSACRNRRLLGKCHYRRVQDFRRPVR